MRFTRSSSIVAVKDKLKAQKQQKLEDKFHVTDELMEWYDQGILFSTLEKNTTEMLKEIVTTTEFKDQVFKRQQGRNTN